MINTKFLFLLSVFVLLAGCASTPCNPPGHVNWGVFCHYKLEVTELKEGAAGQFKVKAKVPQEVLDRNRADDPMDSNRKYENYPDLEYTFYVNKAAGLRLGDISDFHKNADDKNWGRLELGKGE
ncbi:MAG: hypothetical protein H0X47_07915 [Nitrospirales bacterium]|nr:hypothetical protein [Nitrospirales bacterium]